MRSRPTQASLVFWSLLVALASAETLPTAEPPGSNPVMVPVDQPNAIPVEIACGAIHERKLEGEQMSSGGWMSAALDRPRNTLYRAGLRVDPMSATWSDWIDGADVALHWDLSSTGRQGARAQVMEGGLRGTDSIHIVVPPRPGESGLVEIDNRLDVLQSVYSATNGDWPEQDVKILELDAAILLRDVNGSVHSASVHRKLSVPSSVSSASTGSGGATYGLDSDGSSVGLSGTAKYTLGASTQQGEGFWIDPHLFVDPNPISRSEFFSTGSGFDRWFDISSSAQAMLRVDERDMFYDGSKMAQHVHLRNRWERVRITCFLNGPVPGSNDPPDPIEEPGGVTPPGGTGHIAPPGGAASAAPGLTFDLPATIGEGDTGMGFVTVSGAGRGDMHLDVTVAPGGILEIGRNRLSLSDSAPTFTLLTGHAQGTAMVTFSDPCGLVPPATHVIEVVPADPGVLRLSFTRLDGHVGALRALAVYAPMAATAPTTLQVYSSNPAVCTVDGDATTQHVLEVGHRRADLVLRMHSPGESTITAVIPGRGATVSGVVRVTDWSWRGLAASVDDGAIAATPMKLVLTVSEPIPDSMSLTWSIPFGGGKLEGKRAGLKLIQGPLVPGDVIELDYDPGAAASGGSAGSEIELSWWGDVHGEGRLFLHAATPGVLHLLDAAVDSMAALEGSALGRLTARLRRARAEMSAGQPQRASSSLARLMTDIDHPGWGGAAFSAADRAVMRALVEGLAVSLSLDLAGAPR